MLGLDHRDCAGDGGFVDGSWECEDLREGNEEGSGCLEIEACSRPFSVPCWRVQVLSC